MAGGASTDATACVIQEDAIVFCDIQKAHGLAVAVVRQGAKREFHCLLLWQKGHADNALGGRLGKVYFGQFDVMIRHGFTLTSILVNPAAE
jgi:hypothetical protein